MLFTLGACGKIKLWNLETEVVQTDSAIIVALITVIGTAIGSIIIQLIIGRQSNRQSEKNTKLTLYRIEQLEKKQDKHNQVIERVYNLEQHKAVIDEDVKVINHRIEDLEQYHK